MNKNQKIAVIIGLGAIAAMILYPPWIRVITDVHRSFSFDLRTPSNMHTSTHESSAGYGFIFSPPESYSGYDGSSSCRIDVTRLLVQILGVAVVTALAALAIGSRRLVQPESCTSAPAAG
jgi:hypothetical protein